MRNNTLRYYLDATSNCLYGSGCSRDVKPFYTKRQRKCKMFVMGFTTFLSIAALVADWYNFVEYNELTHQRLIFTEDQATDAFYWTFMALCLVSTLFVFAELVAFVFQLKYTRSHDAPVAESELMEELVSAGLLFFENMGLPVLFTVGILMGMCPVNAQIRSFSGRLALLAAALSSIWRLLQSFAFCFACRKDTKLPWCQGMRSFRAFFIVISFGFLSFLTSVSFSYDISLKVDNYNGRYHGERFSDNIDGVYLYQRHLAPYKIETEDDETLCSIYETRINIAQPDIMKEIHKDMYTIRLNCADISPFYNSFIDEQHRTLMLTYQCNIVVGIKNDELTSARIVNAIYELRDPLSSACISGPIELVLDTKYNPGESYAVQLANVWSEDTLEGLSQSICKDGQDSCEGLGNTNQTISYPTFNCNSSSCVSSSTSSNGSSIAIVSHLLVSEKQLLSYYPCMPYVDLHHQLEFDTCQSENQQDVEEAVIEYASCTSTYLSYGQGETDWEEQEATVMDKYNSG